jgi:hypothetical protein
VRGVAREPRRATVAHRAAPSPNTTRTGRSVLVHKDGRLPPEFAALWSHPALLAVAQQLLVSARVCARACV